MSNKKLPYHTIVEKNFNSKNSTTLHKFSKGNVTKPCIQMYIQCIYNMKCMMTEIIQTAYLLTCIAIHQIYKYKPTLYIHVYLHLHL